MPVYGKTLTETANCKKKQRVLYCSRMFKGFYSFPSEEHCVVWMRSMSMVPKDLSFLPNARCLCTEARTSLVSDVG